jgi:hypothetical protein
MAVCKHGNDATTCAWCGDPRQPPSELLVERLYEGDGLYRVQTADARAEDLRVERWYATYNTALNGILSSSERAYLRDDRGRCVAAIEAADSLHGPLVKP